MSHEPAGFGGPGHQISRSGDRCAGSNRLASRHTSRRQRAIDLADGDPSKGNFIIGSPLAVAFTSRALARWCLGLPRWRDDLRHGLAMARSADPMSYPTVVAFAYGAGIPFGVLRPDDSAVHEIEDALRIAEESGDDFVLALARMTLGVALVHRQTAAKRDRGQKLLA